MSRYESMRPCADWDAKHPADALICPECGSERLAEGEESGICEAVARCGRLACPGWMEWKWIAVGSCANCGELGKSEQNLQWCCSRRCMLQLEWSQRIAQGSQRPAASAQVVPISAARRPA